MLVAVGVLLPAVGVPVGAESSGGVSDDVAVADVWAVAGSGGGVVAVGGFGDVDGSSVHAGAIEQLASEGVFDGTECDGGGFCPGEPLQRWVMAVWLVRILDGVDPEPGTRSRFADVEAGVWWEPYVERLAELGVTAGCATAPERYCPHRSVTRGQMATFLGRAYGLADADPAGFVDTGGGTHEASIDALYAAGVTAGCATGPLRYCPQKSVTRAQMATFLLRASTGAVVAAPSPAERAIVVEETLNEAGGVVEAAGVTVTVPAGALGEAVVVAVREPLGRFGIEVGGPIVELDHQRPLVEPVTVTWDVSHLSGDQLGLLLLVTWDEDLASWVTTDDDYTIENGVLVARVRQWSNRTWTAIVGDALANTSQTIQELAGRRVDAPKCEGSLPVWVTGTQRPDENINAAPVRVCYGRGGGETLTMRVANNRVFSQYVSTNRDGGWGDYWLGAPEGSLVWYAHLAAHKLLSDSDGVLVPPLKEVRAEFASSSTPGKRRITFTTGHDFETFLADALFFGLSKVRVPNLGNTGVTSKIQLFFEVLFECGIAQGGVFATSDDANSRLRAAVSALVSCSQEILDPKSQIGGVLRDRLTKKYGPTKGLSEMRSSFPRMANGILAFWEGVGYGADQLLEAFVGEKTVWGFDEKVATGPGPFDEPYSVVAAGGLHTCAIQPDETIACWGDNKFGQASPPPATFTAVAASEYHSCGVRTNGTIECWGANTAGQAKPPIHGGFKGITVGDYHSCGLRTDGTIECWGSNTHAQTDAPSATFVAVAAGGDQTCGIRTGGTPECWGDIWSPWRKPGGEDDVASEIYDMLSTGSDHTCGVRADKSLACWGSDLYGQITNKPDGTFTAVSAYQDSTCALRTNGNIVCWGKWLTGTRDGRFTDVAAGFGHMCATRPDGTIFCVGNNSWGQLNIPDTLTQPTEPTQTRPDATQPTPSGTTISAGNWHSCGVRGDGTVVCWGNNGNGQVDAPSGSFTAISAGGAHSCGVRGDGTVVCWGYNEYGQVDAPSGSFTTISAGLVHSCGVRGDGTVVCWGRNRYGQVDAPSGSFTTIAAGSYHSCGIRGDGTAVCWGHNRNGAVDAPSGSFTTISVGDAHSCGVRGDGTAVCWGYNEYGQAPSGSFTAVSAGYWHSCGVRGDGTAVCWGYNRFGRADAPSGVFATISAGYLHSCGLRTDGSVECWGNNDDGQVDAPSGVFAIPTAARPSVTVTKGNPGPTSLGPEKGTPCAANTPTCRYLNIQLSNFAAGTYTVACSHDGWDNTPAGTWWTFDVTVGPDRSATISRQCFINFASLTGSGAYVTVTRSGTSAVTSNYLK